MTLEEREAAAAELMAHVQEPRKRLLGNLLAFTPGATELFAAGYVYEAFQKVKEYSAAGKLRVSVPIDIDHFLGQVLQNMPSTYQYATSAT
jgi:hypothetical protein